MDDEKSIESRRKKFVVEVSPSRHFTVPGEVDLRISHNGYQFTGIQLTPEERIAVISALLNYKEVARG